VPTKFIEMEYGISVCTPYALQVCLFASESVHDLMFSPEKRNKNV